MDGENTHGKARWPSPERTSKPDLFPRLDLATERTDTNSLENAPPSHDESCNQFFLCLETDLRHRGHLCGQYMQPVEGSQIKKA